MSLFTRRLLLSVLAISIFISACSHDTVVPSGTISGVIPPVAGVGSATSVSVTAADGTVHTVTPDAQTGAFTFSLPAGAYTLTFTTLSAPNTFPARIPVTVTAGATTTPTLPPLTHDGKVRGVMRWKLDGASYESTSLKGLIRNEAFVIPNGKGSLFLEGRLDSANSLSLISVAVREGDAMGAFFMGPGRYNLGILSSNLNSLISWGHYTYYEYTNGNSPAQYETIPNAPASTLQLNRFDATQGVATGTFEFVAAAYSGTGQRIITNGEFEVTF